MQSCITRYTCYAAGLGEVLYANSIPITFQDAPHTNAVDPKSTSPTSCLGKIALPEHALEIFELFACKVLRPGQ